MREGVREEGREGGSEVAQFLAQLSGGHIRHSASSLVAPLSL